MHTHSAADARAGFTLLEILVVLVMLGLLVGAIVPNIIRQAGKGETNRILRDITTVEDAAKNFRVDLTRWPGDLEDLQTQPDASDDDIHGNDYPQGLINRWSGPYLESVELVDDDSLATAAGAYIRGFTKGTSSNGFQLNSVDYLVLTLTGLDSTQLFALDQEVDGESGIGAGRLHISSTTGYYLVAPLQ